MKDRWKWLCLALLGIILASGAAVAYEFSCQVCSHDFCIPVGLDYGFANCWRAKICPVPLLPTLVDCEYICRVSESCEFPPPFG